MPYPYTAAVDPCNRTSAMGLNATALRAMRVPECSVLVYVVSAGLTIHAVDLLRGSEEVSGL
ncbi:hypothetical protein Ahu01nite_099680 [Winogradskya humida]|uniref:Uncharacterized protein n=1 Tax=Winogradskya humida TaxID=113566 RepID=A0ABQ4A7N9_9ACTN|nr:hypothetical protein Ahu01nite_099680 [Actinoplanes humidus]